MAVKKEVLQKINKFLKKLKRLYNNADIRLNDSRKEFEKIPECPPDVWTIFALCEDHSKIHAAVELYNGTFKRQVSVNGVRDLMVAMSLNRMWSDMHNGQAKIIELLGGGSAGGKIGDMGEGNPQQEAMLIGQKFLMGELTREEAKTRISQMFQNFGLDPDTADAQGEQFIKMMESAAPIMGDEDEDEEEIEDEIEDKIEDEIEEELTEPAE